MSVVARSFVLEAFTPVDQSRPVPKRPLISSL
jgi:hypothetical protein